MKEDAAYLQISMQLTATH